MEFNKTTPEMSADFCNRVVAMSCNVKQRHPLSLGTIWIAANNILPVRMNWAVAMSAVIFVIGVTVGMETYVFTDIAEIMDI